MRIENRRDRLNPFVDALEMDVGRSFGGLSFGESIQIGFPAWFVEHSTVPTGLACHLPCRHTLNPLRERPDSLLKKGHFRLQLIGYHLLA